MPQYRSRTSTHGRNMAGARALWRATGMKDEDFKKPIIAIANSFALPKVKLPTSGETHSHGVTGGVYKTRERIHRSMLICDY